MKLEIGKKYRTRYGAVVTIVKAVNSKQPFVGSSGTPYLDNQQWSPNGQFLLLGSQSANDLIEEIKEHNVSDKADKLNKLVDDMPVCSDGKVKIRALVEEITGEKLTKTVIGVHAGQIYRFVSGFGGMSTLRLIVIRGTTLAANGLDGSNGTTEPQALIDSGDYVFVAESLKDYIDNGGKL